MRHDGVLKRRGPSSNKHDRRHVFASKVLGTRRYDLMLVATIVASVGCVALKTRIATCIDGDEESCAGLQRLCDETNIRKATEESANACGALILAYHLGARSDQVPAHQARIACDFGASEFRSAACLQVASQQLEPSNEEWFYRTMIAFNSIRDPLLGYQQGMAVQLFCDSVDRAAAETVPEVLSARKNLEGGRYDRGLASGDEGTLLILEENESQIRILADTGRALRSKLTNDEGGNRLEDASNEAAVLLSDIRDVREAVKKRRSLVLDKERAREAAEEAAAEEAKERGLLEQAWAAHAAMEKERQRIRLREQFAEKERRRARHQTKESAGRSASLEGLRTSSSDDSYREQERCDWNFVRESNQKHLQKGKGTMSPQAFEAWYRDAEASRLRCRCDHGDASACRLFDAPAGGLSPPIEDRCMGKEHYRCHPDCFLDECCLLPDGCAV